MTINNVLGIEVKKRLQDIEDIKYLSAEAQQRSLTAEEKARLAELASTLTREQLKAALDDGDQLQEVLMLRVDPETHETFDTAADMFAANQKKVSSQLAQTTNHLYDVEINIAYPPAPFNALTPENSDTALFQSLIDYCIEHKYKLAFPSGNNRYHFGTWHLNDFIEIDFKNNTLVYVETGDFLVVRTSYRNKPKLKNFTMIGTENRIGNAIKAGRENNSWGGAIDLENFNIMYFNKAFQFFSVHQCEFKTGRISYNNLGVEHHGISDDYPGTRGSFNNMNSFEDVQFINNTVDVKSSHIRQLLFMECSFEFSDVMFQFYKDTNRMDEVFNVVEDITFDNCWFENIRTLFLNHLKDSNGNIIQNSVVDMSVINEINCYYYKVDRHTDYYLNKRRRTVRKYFENNQIREVNSPQTAYITFDAYLSPVDITVKITRKYGQVDQLVKKMNVYVNGRNIEYVDSYYERASKDMADRFAIGNIFYDANEGTFKIPINSLYSRVYPMFGVDLEIDMGATDELSHDHPQTNLKVLNGARLSAPTPTVGEVKKPIDITKRTTLSQGVVQSVNTNSPTTIRVNTDFLPKQITCQAYITNTKIKSDGFWSENGIQRASATYPDGLSTGRDSLVVLSQNSSNEIQGRVKNVSETGFEIEWSRLGIGPTGNANLFILVSGMES